jgi:hypothetical protein
MAATFATAVSEMVVLPVAEAVAGIMPVGWISRSFSMLEPFLFRPA